VDYQVRFFETDSVEEVTARLASEEPCAYANASEETVTWMFDEIVAVEFNQTFTDGKELIGFITGRPTATD